MYVLRRTDGSVISTVETVVAAIATAGLENLIGANLRWANLRSVTLCGACIDGAVVGHNALSGPGSILCCLTAEEWGIIRAGRENPNG